MPDLWQIYCFTGTVKFTSLVFRKPSAQLKAHEEYSRTEATKFE